MMYIPQILKPKTQQGCFKHEPLTLKVSITRAADDNFFLFFRENKS